MAKLKVKNIDYLSQELKDKFNGISQSNLKIGIVCSADVFNYNSYSYNLAKVVEKEILKQGVEAEVVFMPSINERFRVYSNNNYVLNAHRSQISNYLELIMFEKTFDGVVFIPSGFNNTLGCLTSSIRLNLPTLVLPQGISKTSEGSSLQDLLSFPGLIANNEKSIFDLEESQNKFNEFAGTGSTFNTENIFNIILEIMELSLKDSATTFAQSYEKESQAKTIAKTIVELTKNRLPLKRMINRKSVNNALMLNFCLGGSPAIIDAICYLSKEAGVDLDLNKTYSSSKNIPVLFDTNNSFDTYLSNGGTWALIKAMIKNKIIDGNYKTFSDTTLTEETKKIKDYENFTNIIKKESLIQLHGNIADRYALVKTINLPEDKTKVIANAQVFTSDQEACNAVLNKALTDNAIIVIKECGKNTQTKCSTISQTVTALQSMGITNNHVIITDGFVIDDTKAIVISCVTPDSDSGNIRYLKDGDEIEIDFVKGKINAEINAKEFTLRQKKFVKEKIELPKYFNSL